MLTKEQKAEVRRLIDDALKPLKKEISNLKKQKEV
jgi:hypothetical protein